MTDNYNKIRDMSPRGNRVVALTGNIGCGKSTVVKTLKEEGIPCLDADELARTATAPSTPGYQKIVAEFGSGILNSDGTLDRSKLREIVFNDSGKRKKLEAILHPEIFRLGLEAIQGFFEAGKKLVVYEASLIFESGRDKDFDGVLLVTCPQEIIHERLAKRNPNYTRDAIEKIISAQMPQHEKIKRATWLIENNGSLESLKRQTLAWLKSL